MGIFCLFIYLLFIFFFLNSLILHEISRDRKRTSTFSTKWTDRFLLLKFFYLNPSRAESIDLIGRAIWIIESVPIRLVSGAFHVLFQLKLHIMSLQVQVWHIRPCSRAFVSLSFNYQLPLNLSISDRIYLSAFSHIISLICICARIIMNVKIVLIYSPR